MRFALIAAFGCCALFSVTAIAGCSDTTPAPVKGAYSVEFTQGGSDCNLQPHNGDVGSVSATDPGGVVTNAVDNADVECVITGTSTFNVTGTATAAGNSLHVIINAITTKATKDNPAKGSAAFVSPATSGAAYSSPSGKPCLFWFEGKQTVAGGSTGKIWASFSCPEVTQASNVCALDQGVIVFENCPTAAAEE